MNGSLKHIDKPKKEQLAEEFKYFAAILTKFKSKPKKQIV